MHNFNVKLPHLVTRVLELSAESEIVPDLCCIQNHVSSNPIDVILCSLYEMKELSIKTIAL